MFADGQTIRTQVADTSRSYSMPTTDVTKLVQANATLLAQRDLITEQCATLRQELHTMELRATKLEREAETLYGMLQCAEGASRENHAMTRAQVERAAVLRKERFGA